jgi:hypothetical protein
LYLGPVGPGAPGVGLVGFVLPVEPGNVLIELLLLGVEGPEGILGTSGGVTLPVVPGSPGGLTLFGGKLLFGGKPGGLLGTVGFKLGGAPGVGKLCPPLCIASINTVSAVKEYFMMAFIFSVFAYRNYKYSAIAGLSFS